MKTPRTKNAIINILIILIMQVLSFIYSLASKSLFLSKFSLSVYGVVDLFGSFFQSLMLLEMGFGTILIYNLYKPVALNDTENINKQLSLFKTIYATISLIILVIALSIAPFIYNIFNISYQDKLLVYEIYLSNIVKIIFKYHFLNKTSILDAGQYKYYSNVVSIIIDTIAFIIKVLAILVFNNLYLFIFAQLFIPATAYYFASKIVDKKYTIKKIKYASFSELFESGILLQCKKYVYASLYSLVFFAMDNIIISIILSTDAVAYTTNYNSIFSTGWQVVILIMGSIRGIMADYINNTKFNNNKKEVFDIISSFNFIITALLIVGMYSMIDNFIGLWLGYDYLITGDIMLALLLVRAIDCLFEPVNSIVIIEGYIFKEKWSLIISALTNLILTIIFLYQFGLIGAYIATIIALIIKWIGKFYYILSGVFSSYKKDIIFRYLLFIILIGLEMYSVNYLSLLIFQNVTSLVLFIYKFIFVLISTCLINIIVVVLNKNTRHYILHTLLKR